MMIKLLDLLVETKLFELGYKRKDSKNRITFISLNINREILKILMYKDSLDQPHWRGKLNGWLEDVSHLSRNTLKEKDLINLLYQEPIGDIPQLKELLGRVEKKYYIIPHSIDYNNLQNQLKTILTQISKDIVQNKDININNYL
jgi:hypothetical protein